MPVDYCQVCKRPDQESENAGGNRVRVRCQRCGTFEWEPLQFTPPAKGDWVKLSAFVRDQNAAGIVPLLQADLIQQVESRPLPRLIDRAYRALTAMFRAVGYDLYTTFSPSAFPSILATSYSAEDIDLGILLEILELHGLIKTEGAIPTTVRFLPAGFIQAEELSRPETGYVQGFVAMSFDASMNDAYTRGFYVGISAAGYRPFRIDGKEHINGITDEILAEIRRSRFLVADYTEMKNGVYFEAGVAVGLGIPVVATCRADDLAKLHFDIKHINTLKWETPEQLARDLARRISGVLGQGPLIVSPT